MSKEIKAYCYNSSSKPTNIPKHLWIKSGEVYTIIGAKAVRDDKVAVILKEIDISGIIDESGLPFVGYDLVRFGIEPNDLVLLQEMILEADYAELTKEQLIFAMNEAVENEDYLKAAEYRDKINAQNVVK